MTRSIHQRSLSVATGRDSRHADTPERTLVRRQQDALLQSGLAATIIHANEETGTVDLKLQGTAIFVDAARLYALAHGVQATNTRERLAALHGTAARLVIQRIDAGGTIVQALWARAVADCNRGEGQMAPGEVAMALLAVPSGQWPEREGAWNALQSLFRPTGKCEDI